MKRVVCAVAIILLARAAAAENFTVRVGETATIEVPGTTAAYAIDPGIADVSAAGGGRISVTGRSGGTTQLIAITATGTKSFLIRVAAPVITISVPARAMTTGPVGRVESRYSSGSSQVQSSFDVFTEDGERRSEVHLMNVHYLTENFGRSSNAFPSIYYRDISPSRELTLLDELVDLSPITVRSTQIRGVHLRQGPLELHGGYAASTMYEDLFLPADRRWMGSASYAIVRGRTRWIPSVYTFFSEPAGTAARRGGIGSIAAERRSGDTFFVRGEIAASRTIAAAGELYYDGADDRVRGRVAYKPEDFPTLALADVPGAHGEIDWNHRATPKLTFDSYATFDRIEFSSIRQTVGVANVAVRYAVSPHFTILSGVDASVVRRASLSMRTVGAPLGVSFDSRHFGASTAYRVIQNSETSRRGDTLRISARANAGGFRLNVWSERQRQAPTLDVIFREEPGLELALLRLGMSVHSPEDLARLLRDNAALINLGFIEGVSINLTPRRVQSGFDLAWTTKDMRDQLRVHGVFDTHESVGRTQETMIGTLTYSRRLFASTDLYGSYSRWRTKAESTSVEGSAVEVGVRQRFEGVPKFLQRSGTIQGIVYSDPGKRGVPDMIVKLDGTKTVRTDADGAYVFRDVPPGRHRVAVQLSGSRPAFFTTKSNVEVSAGDKHDFGLVWTPARISGRVISDADIGIAGGVINATSPDGPQLTATTDSDGEFVIATPPGRYTLELTRESLPPGYEINGEPSRTVQAKADEPQKVAFEVNALRSIAGNAGGASEVRIEPLGRVAKADEIGNFVFRSLPSGTFTLNADGVSTSVTLPAEPTKVRDIAFRAALPTRRPLEGRPDAGATRIQLGAYRLSENAQIARKRVERLGYHPDTQRIGTLQLLSIGPYESREAAEEHSQRLNGAGIENVITTPNTTPAPSRALSFFVQLGAFRERANARQLARRVTKMGERTETLDADGLMLVRIGPFTSRDAAVKTTAHLHDAGFDAVVTASR